MEVCDFCGTSAPTRSGASSEGDGRGQPSDDRGTPDDVPLTWVTSVENGKRRVYCERCSRDHLRSIESKLHSEWW